MADWLVLSDVRLIVNRPQLAVSTFCRIRFTLTLKDATLEEVPGHAGCRQ